MPQTAFDHGDLPERAVRFLTCPARNFHRGNPAGPSAVAAVDGSSYRAKFKCTEKGCRLEFTVSDAQLRRVLA